MNKFLPVNQKDMKKRGWNHCDFIIVSGDAYVDHPSFAPAVLSRVLESKGYKVGIIPQPKWDEVEAFRVLGEPRLAFLISPGNIDSMVAHYTVNKRLRHQDAYSPGGKNGFRPDRPTLIYGAKVRQAYKGVNVIIGGLEGSLRRLSHYDYWTDKVRRSILLDSKADLLMYGMGERSMVQIASRLDKGIRAKDIHDVRGTVYATSSKDDLPPKGIFLPSYEEVSQNKKSYASSFAQQYKHTDPVSAKPLVEASGQRFVVQNPPAMPLTEKEMDQVYALPYLREVHPMYHNQGGIPALKEVEFSLVHNRGCFGSCNFCAITFHQGRVISSRSHTSVVEEAKTLVGNPRFKGYIHDVGGPTANFRKPACEKQLKTGACSHRSCLTPEPCPHLDVDHQDYLHLLRELRHIKGVKKVFIRSGIRFDYLMRDPDKSFLKELCQHHISGQLKVAPEHISAPVLKAMNKQKNRVYEEFKCEYASINKKIGSKQFMVPYFISSHPGSTIKDAVELALYMKKEGFVPDQVQDYYPTPGTISTCMYYTGLDPLTMKEIPIIRKEREKKIHRALLQFNRPENYKLVREGLKMAGRQDLIGFGRSCLVPYGAQGEGSKNKKNKRKKFS